MQTTTQQDWFGLAGKVALVIGAGQGIGESTALRLAQAGCRLALVDLELERAEAVQRQLQTAGYEAAAIRANILDDADVAAAFRTCEQRLGTPDIVVTVVGQAQYTPALELSGAAWDLDQQRNLRYVFIAAREFAAMNVARDAGGSFIAISSVSGLQSAPRHAAYGAAKAGLVNLVRSLAVEWAPHGLRVNSIAPGTIATPRRPDTPEWRQRVAESGIPMRRRGHTREIADAVVFLASDMASYVTGETLAVDGGWMAANLFTR